MIKNLIRNVKHGQTKNGLSGFDLAKSIASKHEQKSGNKTVVQRILDDSDYFNNNVRYWYSFDVIELIPDE